MAFEKFGPDTPIKALRLVRGLQSLNWQDEKHER
jgi:hypothetical protein